MVYSGTVLLNKSSEGGKRTQDVTKQQNLAVPVSAPRGAFLNREARGGATRVNMPMHRVVRQPRPLPPKPQEFDVTKNYSQDDLLRAVLSRRYSLTEDRRLQLPDWVPRLQPEHSVLVQVGANDHSVHYGNADPGPKCVKSGWRTLLVEPVPSLFSKLVSRYGGDNAERYTRTRLLNAAVCGGTCFARPENRTFWSIDTTNATGNWGTNTSDARCAIYSGAGWISEIASLNQWHLFGQGKNIACAHFLQLEVPSELPYTIAADALFLVRVCRYREQVPTMLRETRSDYATQLLEGRHSRQHEVGHCPVHLPGEGASRRKVSHAPDD